MQVEMLHSGRSLVAFPALSIVACRCTADWRVQQKLPPHQAVTYNHRGLQRVGTSPQANKHWHTQGLEIDLVNMRDVRNILAALSLPVFPSSPVLAMPQPTAAPELVNLAGRASCNADKCLRAVCGNVKFAMPFCSTYTSQPVATIPS